ncbi:Crp/Fnr family transcriptional regulator [Halovulum sp. GXIMD14793]
MKVSEQFPHLLKSPLFADMPKEDARGFLDRCTPKLYRQKTVVLREGEPVEGIFIVAFGTLDIYSTSFNGHRILLHRAGQGEILGELEIMADRPCAASCETARNTTLLNVPVPLLYEHLASRKFMRNLMQTLHKRLRRENQFKVLDKCYPIRQRLSAYLLYLSGRSMIVTDNQSFLAELIGCSRQTINRELGALRDDGAIRISGRKIEIADVDLLRDFSGVLD